MEWEKLIFLVVVVLGSAISGYFQNKKKREEAELERRSPGPGRPVGEPPVPHWPKTGHAWQEELRRVLQGKVDAPPTHQQTLPPKVIPPLRPPSGPPPIVRTKVILPAARKPMPELSEGDVNFPSPLKEASAVYNRAAQLAGRVETRLHEVDAQTQTHKPAVLTRRSAASGATIARRWTRNRESLREAFIASLIFAPPVGLRD
jgi:hypothetical protein